MVGFKDLCTSCKHQGCCTNSSVPLVFQHDLKSLKNIGKSGEKYLQEITIKDKKVKTIRKKENSTMCIFWDENERKCSIYENRPFDCRAYPFDIFLINGKYHWIVYSCNPESGWQWTEDHLNMLENNKQFLEIMKNIEIFSNLDEIKNMKKLHELSYTILREVNFK